MANKENTDTSNYDSDDEEEACKLQDFSLKGASYFPAQTLGEGSYGAVKLVYDEDGTTFAMKEFEKEKEDVEVSAEDSEDSGAEEEELDYESMDLGTLREISVLRLFSKLSELDKAVPHPNIMPLRDITRYRGAMCMVMPNMGCTLTTAIKSNLLKPKQKIVVAHQLLQAVAVLHKNQIMHRDIKCDNVLMDDNMLPVLADFSLAKMTAGNVFREGTHTGGLGTACYRAPEVSKDEGYGAASDVFSLGVCLLELFNGMLNTDRDKAAMKMIQDVRVKLSDKPVPALLKAMLDPDPATRITCEEALALECFKELKAGPIERFLNKECMADVEVKETPKKGKKAKKEKNKKDQKADKNKKRKMDRGEAQLVSLLDVTNPMTLKACKTFQAVSGESLEHCMVLACKFYEADLLTMSYADDQLEGFDADVYAEAELNIFKAMDWCLWV